MVTEIFVEGMRLDLSNDISSLLTFAIDDVKDFSSRSTTFSKTVVLPGTGNNNAIFGNIFETGISNDYNPLMDNIGINFNASKSAKCLIFQDNIQTFKGTLRLLEIDFDKNRIEYEIALNGELTGLSVALSSSLLEDLDFSAYDQQYTIANILASWYNPGGSGVYYPLIDYGTYSTDKHNWLYKAFRPALYVKEYIDKMFAEANYRYTSDLFNTTRFKNLIVPHNQKTLEALNNNLAIASRTTPYTILTSTGIANATLRYQTASGSIFTISLLNSRFTYNGSTQLADFAFTIRGTRHSLVTDFTMRVLKNGVPLLTDVTQTLNSNHSTMEIPWIWTAAFTDAMNTGDYYEFYFVANSSGSDTNYDMIITQADFTIETHGGANILTPVFLNDDVQINPCIPKNIRQVDFLVSIVKLFNLYVYESQFDERLILIKPFIDFFDGSTGDTRDWTYKLNRNAAVKVKPLSEVNSKIYNFNFKDDSDYYNDQYKKKYNQGYGSRIYDSEFEFASQSNTLELIFAATPLVGYGGEDKVYPTIFKQTGTAPSQKEETVDSVIRIMQAKKVLGVHPWNIVNETGVVLAALTNYGYAGHLDSPDDPTNDLNFGALKELFFILATGDLSHTQFNVYWSGYMAEITNKDSKMLTGKFYLTPKDIFDLDFSKFIVVDGVLFRLNKISDYNASQPSDCTVELINVLNSSYRYATYPPLIGPFYLIDSDGSYVIDEDGSKILYQ